MRKQPSITRPDLRGPSLPEGRLILLPFSPGSDLPDRLSRSALNQLSVRPGRLYYLKRTAVLLGGLGAPASIMALEKVRGLGLREIFLLSYCGSIHQELKIGQALLPDRALSQEGTSGHYAPSADGFYFPNKKMVKEMKTFLGRKGLACHIGAIVSTDAPYRETPDWMNNLQRQKIMAVDMEMSAVLSFATFYRLGAAGLFIVSDELFTARWQDGSDSFQVLAATARYFYPLIFET